MVGLPKYFEAQASSLPGVSANANRMGKLSLEYIHQPRLCATRPQLTKHPTHYSDYHKPSSLYQALGSRLAE